MEPPRPRFSWTFLHAVGKVVCALAIGGAIGGGSFFGYRRLVESRHFSVREVRISPTTRVSQEALRARAGIALGTNLLTLDLEVVRRNLEAEPWLAAVRVRRELPGVVTIDVVERQPACLLALGGLYLADARGEVFKRATPEEAGELPVVTGIPRDGYVDDRDASQALVREALAALAVWREKPGRPAIGEVHVDVATGVTLYTTESPLGVRIGHASEPGIWRDRLGRYDTVARALATSGERAEVILVDQRRRPDRVTVRLAAR